MTVDTTERTEAGARLSFDWLRRLQKALTAFCALTLTTAALTVAVCAYAAVTADDNPLKFIVGDVPQLEEAMELQAMADYAAGTAPQVVHGNPEGVRLQIYTALGWLPSLLLVAALLFVLRRTIRRARASDAFTADTADGLRLAGRMVLGGGVAVWLAESSARIALNTETMEVRSGEEASWFAPFTLRALIVDLPWLWVLAGLSLLAVAAVFARGIAMRRDLDGLV